MFKTCVGFAEPEVRKVFSHAFKDTGDSATVLNDSNSIDAIDETPENSSELPEDSFNENIALKRNISNNSFLSPNSESLSEKKRNLKNKPFNFSEEETTFKPPRRTGAAGRTGQHSFRYPGPLLLLL